MLHFRAALLFEGDCTKFEADSAMAGQASLVLFADRAAKHFSARSITEQNSDCKLFVASFLIDVNGLSSERKYDYFLAKDLLKR